MGFLKDFFKADPEVDFQMALRAETIEGNWQKAAWLYEKAAQRNHPKAEYFLALLYLKGRRGIDKDTKKGLALMIKSASQGFYKAQYLLSQMYLKGAGVRQNVAEGNRWMSKATGQGYELSQLSSLDSELEL